MLKIKLPCNLNSLFIELHTFKYTCKSSKHSINVIVIIE